MARFKKGAPSANPAGRPRGSKSAVGLLRGELVSESDLATIVAKVVELAKGGDLMAAGMILDRSVPKVKAAADPVNESAVAELVAEARVRAMRNGGAGLSLESIVVLSGIPEPGQLAFVAEPAQQSPPLAAPQPEPVQSPPARALRMNFRDDDEGGRAITEFDIH